MGWQTIFTCDNDPFCKKILKHYWPKATHYDNIKDFDATKYRGRIDILTGGFPCQPFSIAGKRKGTSDDRYLWPEMLRVIRESRPRWVVAENVYGLINWNEGMVFEQVHADLEREGYQVQSYVLPAAGVGAPHRRYRVWIIAYANRSGQLRSNRRHEKLPGKAGKHAQRYLEQMGIDANRCCEGLAKRPPTRELTRKGARILKQFARSYLTRPWKIWPVEPPLCGPYDGLPKELDGITFPRWRRESITAYGNAIVPQVAHQLFQAIQECERAMYKAA